MADDIRKRLAQEKVSHLDPPPGLRIDATESVQSAVALMKQNRTGCVLVCNGDRLVGIFTERDYLRRILGEGRSTDTPMSECMTPDPHTVRTSDSMASLIACIHQKRVRHVPVVNAEGALEGCVTVRNVLSHLSEHYPHAIYTVAPVSKPKQNEREGA